MNHRILAALLLLPFLVSCGVTDSGEPTESVVRLDLGAETQLATRTIGASGGTLLVPPTADTLGGITITVPPDAYADTRTFSVSYAPITGIENGGDYSVISPLIYVENGGEYAQDMMTMKVPVDVPAGTFAMAFAWDEASGFEAIPILDQDAGSVTLWTTHFEHSAIHDAPLEKRALGQGNAAGRRRSALVIIARNMEKLMNGSTATSFRPGTDDWSFRNLGSTIAPGGHCAGQSWGMMYYYMDQKRKGAAQLNGRFDNNGGFATPQIWHDDVAAYRYCSVLQANYNSFVKIGFTLDKQLLALGRTAAFRDSLTFMAYKLAMHVTKLPQFVTIWTGDNQSAHAMVVYGANASELNICDPNYPGNLPGGNTRVIRFGGGRFEPYTSGPDADHLGTAYPVIWFYGTTSGMNWTVAKQEWASVPNRTAGATYFPSYFINVRDSATDPFMPLASGWKSRTGRVQVQVISPDSALSVQLIFRPDPSTLKPTGGWFTIPDGRNQLGFLLQDSTTPQAKWAGFKWFEIVGKDAPAIPRCTREKTWEGVLGMGNLIYDDSSAQGRRLIFEDLSEPVDICSDEHIHPQWVVRGDLSGLKIVAKSYWSLFGRDAELTPVGSKATGTIEIGLKQAFDNKPGYIGLQTEFIFPSLGSRAADLAWFAKKKIVSKITLVYKEHAP